MSFLERKISIKIIFTSLVVAAGAGLLLRLAPFVNFDFNQYNIRQAHSHLAFLGWVFSALIWLINRYLITDLFSSSKTFRIWFIVEFVISSLLFISFLAFGYGKIPIILLSLHSLISYWGIIKIFIKSKKLPSTLKLPLRLGVIGFLISSIGPILIPLIKNGIILEGQSLNIGINLYLHFHYNAWFLFTLIAIIFSYLEFKQVLTLGKRFKLGLYLMFAALFVNYLDSLYWIKFPEWTEYIFFLSSAIQLLGFYMVIVPVLKSILLSENIFLKGTKIVLILILLIWESKYLFELIVNLPSQPWFNVGNHFLQIAYLHWVFLGIVTPTLIFLFQELNFLPRLKIYNVFFWSGWLGTEILLVLMGLGILMPNVYLWLAVYSALMFIAFIGLLIGRRLP
jgi:hypothetical protein